MEHLITVGPYTYHYSTHIFAIIVQYFTLLHVHRLFSKCNDTVCVQAAGQSPLCGKKNLLVKKPTAFL